MIVIHGSTAGKTSVLLIRLVAAALTLYATVSFTAFAFRNPKANGAAAWAHLGSTLTFARLPQFQEVASP